jgi:hypothetical protein
MFTKEKKVENTTYKAKNLYFPGYQEMMGENREGERIFHFYTGNI